MHAKAPGSPRVSKNGGELSRLISAAVVSREFRDLLLTNPEMALAGGYNGESFHLDTEDHEFILSTQASSLPDLVLQLTTGRNGRENGRSVSSAHDDQL